LTFKGINTPKKKSVSDHKLPMNRRKSKLVANNNILFESFSEIHVRSLFLDFIVSLFEAYDENKHYVIDESDQDVHFEVEMFIDDSKSDIRQFLKL
jgi:hypothetical protein